MKFFAITIKIDFFTLTSSKVFTQSLNLGEHLDYNKQLKKEKSDQQQPTTHVDVIQGVHF